MTSNTEIMTMNNTTNNSNTTNSTDNKSNNESYSSLQSKFAVHVRHDKRKKFFTRATSAKITVKEFFDFIKTAYQVNESLEQIISDVVNNENSDINDNSNGNVNWTKLANNQLINQLITIEQQQQQQQKLQELNKKENECQTSTTNTNENQQIESTTNQNNRIRSRQSQLSVLKASDSITSQQITASTPIAAASSSVASFQTTNQNQQTTEVKQSSINMLHDMMDEIICEGILDKVLPYLTPTDLQLTSIIPTINNNSNNNITQPIIKKQQTIMGTSTSGDHKKIIKHESPARTYSIKMMHPTRKHAHLHEYYQPNFVKISSTITNADIKRLCRNIRNNII